MKLIEKIFAPFQKAMKQSVSSFIRLETIESKNTLVASDGSLVSYVKVEGSKQIIGDEEYDQIVSGATMKVGSRFDRMGHAMQVYFARDPGRIHAKLEEKVRPSRVTARAIGLEVDDLFEERIRHLEKFLTHEEIYFVLWTRPSALTKNEYKRCAQDAKEEAKKWVPAGYAQYPLGILEPLRTRHKSYVSAVMSAMDESLVFLNIYSSSHLS